MRDSLPPIILILSMTGLAACGERPAGSDDVPPPLSVAELPPPDIFQGIPLVPGSRLVSGSADAAEALVRVPIPADSLANVYRRILTKMTWDIRGDVTTPDGNVTLHARSAEDRPVWIMIRPLGADSSEVSLIATVVDSATTPR